MESVSSLTEEWAASLRATPELECESILVNLSDESELLTFPDLVEGFAKAGLGVPVSARLPASLLSRSVTWPIQAARCVVDVELQDGFATLENIVHCAESSGTPLEWCLGGSQAGLSSQLDRVLEASGSLAPFAFSVNLEPRVHSTRLLIALLHERGLDHVPVVLHHGSPDEPTQAVRAAIEMGSSLCDGLGDMVSLDGTVDCFSTLNLGYRILQGSRLRTTRTEYISCPSCGRTLFDLEQTTARIKEATAHLVGVKIAVMGCIVNGPGEMADADFGYVGSGPGVVTLYVGKEVVARNIPEQEAPDRLTELIHEHGF